ncbi:glycosyltransferase family 2 protein [Sphingobacterium multivorum]|uniref:Chondroitin polymerase n=1 Tax=Sphingobacterium multivorum TaxID=28454 RepID=A0A2X2J222_SPHMU|nr:glycosyltransferase family A protein [Sphingobacterium multivorum]QRQ61181.1 glycosyltransferase family 2 protein [Sphingobacterium multivorum]SPZ88427.1 Chondroitin polymerase [Sphingobacterium multivorum]
MSIDVSVVIPMYNSEDTIVRALQSVVQQTYQGNVEIIVVNDGSQDNSENEVIAFKQAYPQVDLKLISQPNGGVSKARNTGLRNASGMVIALLDSDDEWLANKLEWQLPYLRSDIDFVTCLRNNDRIGFPYKLIDDKFASVTLRKLMIKVVGQTSTAVFKRSILERIGLFDENQKYSEDANYWMKASRVANMVILNKKLVITGGGKPSVGFSGLSSNIAGMEQGVQKNIKEMYTLRYINIFEYFFFRMFSRLKYVVRKLKYK